MHQAGKCGCAEDNWDNKVRALSCHFAFHGYYPLNLGDPNTPNVATWTGPTAELYLRIKYYEIFTTVRELHNVETGELISSTLFDPMQHIIDFQINKYTGNETVCLGSEIMDGVPTDPDWADPYTLGDRIQGWGANSIHVGLTQNQATIRCDQWKYKYSPAAHAIIPWGWNVADQFVVTVDVYTQLIGTPYPRTEYEALFNALLARVTHARIREKYNETHWAEAGTVGYNADGTIGERWLVHDETITIDGTEYPNTTWEQTITTADGLSGPGTELYDLFVSRVDGSAWSYDDDNVLAGFDNTMLNQNGFADSVGISQSYFGWGCSRYTQYQVCDPTRYCTFPGFESYCTLTIWPVDPETETDVIVQFIARPINFCPQWNEVQLPPNCCTTDAVGTSKSLELGGAGYWQEWKRSELGACSACP